ncbi:MAG: 4Fe-4S binding protein [Candidatus Omnitrophota bacterium]|jgi:ferredoxin
MKRKIIQIDEDKCDGCGLCIPNCPEGAIRIVNGKAKLVADALCDGLGACLGRCPAGAITVEERDAEGYDERQVVRNIAKQGHEAVQAHLTHLREHNEKENLEIALATLKEVHGGSGCPGSKSMSFQRDTDAGRAPDAQAQPSALNHWPIQLHLLSPQAPHYARKDLLLAADCVPFALGNFHSAYLSGKALAIACPKLDDGQEIYLEKLVALVDEAEINTLTVMTMMVPCCTGLLRLAEQALGQAKRKIPLKHVVVGLEGNILSEKWLSLNN